MAICPVCGEEYEAGSNGHIKATCSSRCDSRARYRRLEGAPLSNAEFAAYRAKMAVPVQETRIPAMAGGAWACGCGSRACRKGCRPTVTDVRRYQEMQS